MTEKSAGVDGLLITEEFMASDKFEKAIGNNIPYYRSAFRQLLENPAVVENLTKGKEAQTKIKPKDMESKFNWPAAIFLPWWLAYRKMWMWSLILSITMSVLSGYQDRLMASSGATVGLIVTWLVVMYYSGKQANYLYLAQINQWAKASNGDDDEFLSKAGTSIWGLVGMFLLTVFLDVIIREFIRLI